MSSGTVGTNPTDDGRVFLRVTLTLRYFTLLLLHQIYLNKEYFPLKLQSLHLDLSINGLSQVWELSTSRLTKMERRRWRCQRGNLKEINKKTRNVRQPRTRVRGDLGI